MLIVRDVSSGLSVTISNALKALAALDRLQLAAVLAVGCGPYVASPGRARRPLSFPPCCSLVLPSLGASGAVPRALLSRHEGSTARATATAWPGAPVWRADGEGQGCAWSPLWRPAHCGVVLVD